MNGVIADEVRIETRGAVREADVARVRAKIAGVTRFASAPVLFVRIRLSVLRGQGAVAQANVDVNGRPVRVQATGATMGEAIAELGERLRRRLERLARLREHRTGPRPPANGRGGERAHRRDLPSHAYRMPGSRWLTRHKTFALRQETVAEAAEDMYLLDYAFHLFTESGSGQDSVLYRDGSSYRLAQIAPDPAHITQTGMPFSISPVPAAHLDVPDALAHLDQAGMPFVFFADATTGRGSMVYRRVDGNYGLIEVA